jgi:hypothetical protein
MPLTLSMPVEPRLLLHYRVIGEITEALQKRVEGIDSWLPEIGTSCKVEQKHCEEGTVELALENLT